MPVLYLLGVVNAVAVFPFVFATMECATAAAAAASAATASAPSVLPPSVPRRKCATSTL